MKLPINIKNYKIQNYSIKFKVRLYDEEVYKLNIKDEEIINMTERNLRFT